MVFRKFRDGHVIALFPRVPWDLYGYHCASYMHVGQHGDADLPAVISQTKAARPDEYASLLKELHKIGYRNLIIGKKTTYSDFQFRQKEAARIRTEKQRRK